MALYIFSIEFELFGTEQWNEYFKLIILQPVFPTLHIRLEAYSVVRYAIKLDGEKLL